MLVCMYVIEIVVVLRASDEAVKAKKDLCYVHSLRLARKNVHVCICRTWGDKMWRGAGVDVTPGNRDIWLQIYCRGLVGFLSCFYDSIPHSPQAVLSLTFTSSDPLGLLLLLYVSYKGGGYFIWSSGWVDGVPLGSNSTCYLCVNLALLVDERSDTRGSRITPMLFYFNETMNAGSWIHCAPLNGDRWMGISDAAGIQPRKLNSPFVTLWLRMGKVFFSDTSFFFIWSAQDF